MELTESIKSINEQLSNLFGTDTLTGLAIWRVAFSSTQYEKRLVDVTDSGVQLLTPEVRLVPKYNYINDKYILEQLVLVPEVSQKELAGAKMSYEPLWTFEDNNGNYLPPTIQACKFVIDTVYTALGKAGHGPKYKDPDSDPEEAVENRINRVKKLQEELFGNETQVSDSLAYHGGIVVPSNYKRD